MSPPGAMDTASAGSPADGVELARRGLFTAGVDDRYVTRRRVLCRKKNKLLYTQEGGVKSPKHVSSEFEPLINAKLYIWIVSALRRSVYTTGGLFSTSWSTHGTSYTEVKRDRSNRHYICICKSNYIVEPINAL